MANKLTIGKLAWLANVNVETVRYYQRRGLLEQPDKPLRGHRHYSEKVLKQLLFIKQAQKLGFSLDEIGTFANFGQNMNCMDIHDLLESKKISIRQQLAELVTINETLEKFLCHCTGQGCPKACPVIDIIGEHAPCKNISI